MSRGRARAWRFGRRAALVLLFFVSSDGRSAIAAEAVMDEETRAVVERLRQRNQELQRELDQHAATVRLLTENLAIARTESELFQRRWTEARLRAETLGVDLADTDVANLQLQVIESVRSLHAAEQERQRLVGRLNDLVQAIEASADLRPALVEARRVIDANSLGLAGIDATAAAAATLQAAEVIDVSAQLRVAVVNLGSDQGARVGMPLVVLRDERVVAELRVIEVRRRVCGALIESQEAGLVLQAGDGVRVSKN